MNLSNTTLLLAVTTALGATGTVNAAENPFGARALDNGYMQMAEGKTKDAKCGEGKCADKTSGDKTKEAKCGEGKCGGDGNKDMDKSKEAKCGEGKCGNA
jgi:uncharacterized low-complexity protein